MLATRISSANICCLSANQNRGVPPMGFSLSPCLVSELYTNVFWANRYQVLQSSDMCVVTVSTCEQLYIVVSHLCITYLNAVTCDQTTALCIYLPKIFDVITQTLNRDSDSCIVGEHSYQNTGIYPSK